MRRKMKDSGIEWIGEIPEEWGRTSLINVLRKHISDGPHETPVFYENGIPFISVDSLNSGEKVNLDIVKRFISQEDYDKFNKKSHIEKGDILFSKAATIGKTAIVDDEIFMVWSPLAIIKSDANKCNNKFIYFILNCYEMIKYVSLLGGYNTQINVGMRNLEKAFIPIPLIKEQTRIANYLDSRCNLIDQTIEKQKQVIGKLKEYKQSVITETVTKGLNPNVPMKESGIEWIGEIPEACKVIIVKRIFKSVLGKMVNDKPTGIEDSLEKYLCALNVHFDGISLEIVKEMYFSPKEKEQYELMNGDLLVVEGGAGAGGASIVNFCDGDTGYYIQNSIHLIRSANGNANLKYLFYNLYSLVNRGYIDFVCNKATIPHFTKEKLLNVPIVNRSLLKQTEIAIYLDKKCETIDEIIRIKASVLSKLESYKKSLIYECVTGKREVM